MTLEEFKILHAKFTNPETEVFYGNTEYEDYIDAIHSNKDFENWTLIDKLNQASFEYEKYCCLKMSDNIFESFDKNGDINYDNPDVIINEWTSGTIGIPIHDGGTSMIEINFCPWCGSKLKKSR